MNSQGRPEANHGVTGVWRATIAKKMNANSVKFVYALFLIIGIVVSLAFFLCLLPQLEVAVSIDAKAEWENKQNLSPRPGPSWFVYDKAEKVLRTGRPINDDKKRELLGLIGETNGDLTYQEAIDKLAYLSNKQTQSKQVITLILYLGILSGILGVLIRSISGFIFHACVLNDLELTRWWPWYVLRPFLGAAVAVTLIVLLKSQLIALSEPDQFGGFWLLGLCIIAGFGADEFTNKLFFLSRTIFGESTGENTKSPNEGTNTVMGVGERADNVPKSPNGSTK